MKYVNYFCVFIGNTRRNKLEMMNIEAFIRNEKKTQINKCFYVSLFIFPKKNYH